MKDILILGANGLIGKYLSKFWGNKCDALTRAELDISDQDQFENILRANDYKWVINCAGSAVGDHSDLLKLNAIYPNNLAKICKKYDVGFVFLSTARVFGSGVGPFDEKAVPDPYDEYGISKYVGEQLVKNELAGANYYIFRLGIVYGAEFGHKNQFAIKMIDLAKKGHQLNIASDSYNSFVHATDVAEMLAQTINQGKPSGVYHITSQDTPTVYSFVYELFKDKDFIANLHKGSQKDFNKTNLPFVINQGLSSSSFIKSPKSFSKISLFWSEYNKCS